MKYFYKIQDGKLIRGSGTKIPDGMTEYTKGSEPEEMIDILNAEAVAKAEKEYMDSMIKTVEGHVQEQVSIYNIDNKVMFKDVDSCAKYITVDTYAHVDFCKSMMTFNADVWTKAREVEQDVIDGNIDRPTIEEFSDMLPVYGE